MNADAWPKKKRGAGKGLLRLQSRAVLASVRMVRKEERKRSDG